MPTIPRLNLPKLALNADGTVKSHPDIGSLNRWADAVQTAFTGLQTGVNKVTQTANTLNESVSNIITNNGLLPGMLAPLVVTPPVLADLTWGNQNSATAFYNQGGALVMSEAIAPYNIPILYKTAPIPPWTLTVGFISGIGPSTGGHGNDGGILLRESATGKMIGFFGGVESTGQGPVVIGDYFPSFTSFTTNAFAGYNVWCSPIMWLQVVYDGTNINLSAAADGQNFQPIYSETHNNFFTSGPDQAGIGINPQSATTPCNCIFVHFSGI